MKIYKIAPCPIYDIECMQAWLEKMASQGLFLTKSFFLTAFERELPRTLRYRIAPLPKKSEAHEEAIAIVEESGWHFIKKSNNLAIYMTEDHNAPELYSDVELPEEVFHKLYKNARWNVLASMLGILPFFIIINKNGLIHVATELGMFFLVISEIAILSYFAKGIVDILYLRKAKKHFKEDKVSKHSSMKSFLYRALHVIGFTSLVLTILAFFSIDNISKNRLDIASYKESLPFDTVSDIYPDATLTPENMNVGSYESNTLKVIQNDICNEFIDYKEYVDVKIDNQESSFTKQLDIKYYDLKYTWLADQLARDIYQSDTKKSDVNDYTENELPTNVKYAYYTFFDAYLNIVIVNDNQVIKICIDNFDKDSSHALSPQEIINHYIKAD